MGAALPPAGVSRKKHLAITALLTQGTVQKAADACGIPKRTLDRWLGQATFRAQLDHARDELLRMALAGIARVVERAVTTLEEMLAPDVLPTVRVSAARSILEYALRVQDMRLDERISALEKTVTGQLETIPHPSDRFDTGTNA